MVLHDGFGELLWASDDWDLEEKADLVKDAIANAMTDPAEFPGVVRIDADRAVYSFAVRARAGGAARRRIAARRASRARAPRRGRCLMCARSCSPRSSACAASLACARKLGSRERDLGVRERDLSLMLEMSSNQTATGDADEFDLILKTALEHMGCALAALWVPDKNIGMSLDPQRESDVGRIAAARAAAPDGLDPAAAAHHHRQSDLQSRERRWPRPYKILACPGAPPVRARNGRAGAVQSRERA